MTNPAQYGSSRLAGHMAWHIVRLEAAIAKAEGRE